MSIYILCFPRDDQVPLDKLFHVVTDELGKRQTMYTCTYTLHEVYSDVQRGMRAWFKP